MVYDWENKEDICYRLYIEEKKSLEEIMEYMKEEHKFSPRYVSDHNHSAWACDLGSTYFTVLSIHQRYLDLRTDDSNLLNLSQDLTYSLLTSP